MEKTATLNSRADPEVKKNAESVLKRLGIPMSAAVDMYLNQIALTGGIPFSVALPKAPGSIDADRMTSDEINAEPEEGYADMKAGEVHNASSAFKKFREDHVR